MGRRVAGAHRVAAHADVCNVGLRCQRAATQSDASAQHLLSLLTCRHFVQSHQATQHLGEVEAQQQVAGFKRLLTRERAVRFCSSSPKVPYYIQPTTLSVLILLRFRTAVAQLVK